MQKIKEFIRNDSMSLALFGLFLVCAVSQSLSGWVAYRGSLSQARMPVLGYWNYLGTGNFLDSIFSNWQAAILQLAVLISFSCVLRQKGAAHSRQPQAVNHRALQVRFSRRDTPGAWLWANSLSLVFFMLFVLLFALHWVFSHMAYDEQQAIAHLPPATLGAYFVSANFWFTVFQCWEAEFGAIGLYIVFSIFLRQESSPESKPVAASDGQTGGPNE